MELTFACVSVVQASRSLAQTIPVTISNFGYGTQILLYGQPQTYTANLTVPAGSPVPQGSLLFENQTTILSTAALATTGTTQGSSLVRLQGKGFPLTVCAGSTWDPSAGPSAEHYTRLQVDGDITQCEHTC